MCSKDLETSEDLETWAPVELDTEANLNAVCPGRGQGIFAVGDDGTMVWTSQGDWGVKQYEPQIDLIACSTSYFYLIAVGADQTVYVESGPDLEAQVELDWQPRALDPQAGWILVGDGGRVGEIVASGLIPQ